MQQIQKAYIKTYEEDVKIYKDIENSQGTLLLQKSRPLYIYIYIFFIKNQINNFLHTFCFIPKLVIGIPEDSNPFVLIFV